MNISIHVSYIFGSKQNLDIEENTEETEELDPRKAK